MMKVKDKKARAKRVANKLSKGFEVLTVEADYRQGIAEFERAHSKDKEKV